MRRSLAMTAVLWLAAAPVAAQPPDAGATSVGEDGAAVDPQVVPDAGTPMPDADPERVAEARALFEQGIAYAGQERWGEALEYFRRSRRLVDRPSTAFNVAVALLRLGRPTEAQRALVEYLDVAGEAPSEEERRAEARRLLELALRSIATVELIVEPADADVRVDGELIAGDTAQRRLPLDPGTHAVRVTAEGFVPQSFELSLLDGETTRREVTLVPDPTPRGPARLTIASSVASARIHIDSEEVGQGTWTGELEPGRHRIEVRAEGHEPFRRTVSLSPAERLDLQASLSHIREPGLFERPLFWIVAGALVVGAGVAIGVAVGSGTEDPYPGTTGVVLQGLRF